MKKTWAFAVLVASAIPLTGTGTAQSTDNFALVSTIAFSSVHDPTCLPVQIRLGMQPSIAEIYLMNPDNTNVRRLTDNENCTHFDNFASLSPDGKKIVFESNRLRFPNDPLNTSDLFLMDPDGSNQTWLLRGSSASWSPALANNNHGAPQGRQIVFHASASGHEGPIRADPGAPSFDSDLFVVNIDDCLAVANCRDLAHNITKDLQPDPNLAPSYNGGQFTPASQPAIDEDADWSPDGLKIVFTSHPAVTEFCPPNAPCNDYRDTEIYVVNSDGTGLKQLTHNGQEERAPAWSSDGSRILYMCRIGDLNTQGGVTFEVCVMSADGDGDGTEYTRVTWNAVLDAAPSWSADGTQIVFHRNPPPFQLWLVRADTICANKICTCPDTYANGKCETLLAGTPSNDPIKIMFGFPHWGVLRVHVPKQ